MKPARTFPLVPKSTKWLQPGDFWAVPLSGGKFACGRVLQVDGEHLFTPTRAFFGGLLDWISDEPPTEQAIAGHVLLESAVMHIRAITRSGGAVLGHRALDLDKIEVPIFLNAMGGRDVNVLHGARILRPARPHEFGKYPVLGYWGYPYIQDVAEHRLMGRQGAG